MKSDMMAFRKKKISRVRVLGEGEIGRGYELGIDDPVARLLSRYFVVSTPKRKMDDSPGEMQGEIDHFSRDAAVEYLLMPERLKKMEGKLDALHHDFEELLDLLRQALQPPSNNLSEKRVDYVS